MVETLCTSGAVKHRAGTNASTTVTNSGAWMTELINQSEGDFIADTRVNWIDLYGSMNADFKQQIEGAVAAKAAVKVISYDMAGFTDRAEAVSMINVLWAEYMNAVRTLSEDKVVNMFGGTKGQ